MGNSKCSALTVVIGLMLDSIRAKVFLTSSSAATLRKRKCSEVIEFALELLTLVGADKDELRGGTVGGNWRSLPRFAKLIDDGIR